MDGEQTFSLVVVALCMATVGTAATTLDATVSAEPSDQFDLPADAMALDQGSAERIDEQIQSNERRQKRVGDDEQQSDLRSGAGETSRRSSSTTRQTRGSTGQVPPTLLDRLIASPRELLALVAPVLVAALVVVLAYRYRDRLLGLALAPLALGRDDASETGSTGDDPWSRVEPDDEVTASWLAMVEALDADRPWAKTPAECRAAAVEAGFDPDAVDALTRVFRETRYGPTGPTDDQRRRARRSLDRLGLGGAVV